MRDAGGKPREAEVAVKSAGGDAKVARVGDVYIADGLIDGDYTVSIHDGGETTVHVQGRIDRGVVFVLGGKKPAILALGPKDTACDPIDGAVVEAVAFSPKGGLGAGRLDVKRGGKIVCSAIVAGGAATLRLLPGDYQVNVKLVGGGAAMERYRFPEARIETPYPLALRTRYDFGHE